MEKKDFILVLVALIILSGGYYLYANNLWPFGSGSASLPAELSGKIYVVGGIAKEVYDTVIVFEIPEKIGSFEGTELMAVVNENTNVFRYETSSAGSVVPVKLSIKSIKVGDKIALTSDDDIAGKTNGVFLASSIAVYNR
ncbi:MAG: hypothetical protein PHZ25_00905 [Candidatus Pacebacteria bacterium]|nr:hypothetical protein [Candidatus Paceibacterota bacterium]